LHACPDCVEASRKKLTHTAATHGHGDHWFTIAETRQYLDGADDLLAKKGTAVDFFKQASPPRSRHRGLCASGDCCCHATDSPTTHIVRIWMIRPNQTIMATRVSRRGESHPPPLSGPDVTVSRHPAPTVRP
jgi:hypothetical protein